MKSGKTRVTAATKVCIERTGFITAVRMMKSSGFPAYDDEIKAAVLAWKYKPYLVNGVATPACTTVMFIYSPS